MKELAEETGVSDVRIVGHLGADDYDLRPYRDVVEHRHFFHLAVAGAVVDEWDRWEMGGPDEVREDDGVRLRHYWLEISRCHALAGGLGAMLGRLAESVAPASGASGTAEMGGPDGV